MSNRRNRNLGHTLIELLAALFIMVLLAGMAYRALGSVLDAQAQVRSEAQKWQRVSTFLERFERDTQMAAPRGVRAGGIGAAAWVGRPVGAAAAVEFSRFGGAPDEPARRLSYRLNDRQEIELWVWPGLDALPDAQPARYPVLAGVTGFELRYYNAVAGWVDRWPQSPLDAAVPRALRLSLTLEGGQEIVRIFALKS